MLSGVGMAQGTSDPRHEAALLASMIATARDAFVVIDGEARILEFNPAAERMFGWTAEEVRGHKVNMLMPEPYASEHDGYLERYEQTGEGGAIGRIRTVQAKRRDGEVFPMELSVTRVESDGEARYGAFIRDISEKIRLQRELGEQERLATIGTTAAKFAHEVGNPLNGMAMNLQLLERRIAGRSAHEALEPIAGRIRDGVERLSELLEEFRQLSRRQHLHARGLDLTDLLRALVEEQHEAYGQARVGVRVDLPAILPAVWGDGRKLTQVFLNLCKNAAEAMPGGGTITLRAEAVNGGVAVRVEDEGEGVAEGIDVFEPFVTTKDEGTGLGLPVVRQIVAAHGGTVRYERGSGGGTTFVVTLPRAEHAAGAETDAT